MAASAWRWQTEQAAGEPMSRPQKSGSDRGPTSGGHGSSKPGDIEWRLTGTLGLINKL